MRLISLVASCRLAWDPNSNSFLIWIATLLIFNPQRQWLVRIVHCSMQVWLLVCISLSSSSLLLCPGFMWRQLNSYWQWFVFHVAHVVSNLTYVAHGIAMHFPCILQHCNRIQWLAWLVQQGSLVAACLVRILFSLVSGMGAIHIQRLSGSLYWFTECEYQALFSMFMFLFWWVVGKNGWIVLRRKLFLLALLVSPHITSSWFNPG